MRNRRCRILTKVGLDIEMDRRISTKMPSDYSEWIQLQTTAGGLPASIIGYCLMLLVKIFAHYDLRNPNLIDPREPAGKYLDKETVPSRPEERPGMHRWPVPQRQVNQIPNDAEYEMLTKHLDTWIFKQKEEGKEITKGQAFDSLNAYYLKGYELFHIHPIDKSLHCMMHPADGKLLVEKGWAEWFGLTGKVWQPRGCVFHYSVRTGEEMAMLEKVWDAAVAFVIQEKIKH